jgi:putative sigma-54 modulation protein
MQININAVHFKADKKLEGFITDKLQKIGKFHENIIGGDVILKLENTDKPENKIAEIRLKVKGNDLISCKQCKTFEEATDLAVDALRKQLEKLKDKKRQ